jgi:hypothetical protein
MTPSTSLEHASDRKVKHDLLTSMYLRQYAFLMRCSPRMSPGTAFHYSTLAVSGIVSLAVLAAIATALWISSQVFGKSLIPWLLPNWALVICAFGIAFLPGMYIDRKMAFLRTVEDHLIAMYSSRHQRVLWLLTILSIIPLATIVGLCFGSLGSGA